jgi:hypothetical protein
LARPEISSGDISIPSMAVWQLSLSSWQNCDGACSMRRKPNGCHVPATDLNRI